jgi:hypothetical protein
MTYEITIHLAVPSQNQTERGKTWQTRAHYTKLRRTMWKFHCINAMRLGKVPNATGKRHLSIVVYRQRMLDIGNLIGGMKSCVDGFIDAGLLVDDKPKFASLNYIQKPVKQSPTKIPCVVITIEDI